jgi:hypothetical protein
MADNRLALKCGGIEPKQRAGELVAKRKPFSNVTGSFRGFPGSPGTLGWLPEPWRSEFPTRVSYSIMSWDTPMAWLTTDGYWVMPDVRYSQMTSVMQGTVRAWLLTGEEVRAA